ncbi:hypothetical protein CHELA20_50402 [Hyphomicrobiales bacterium]|nr:hypothetical protein CHELA20_50402 [Hyphomicrobiales bacterium]CAH1679740.1 hypothetical protein CHELA41_24723 [Hyphomicrobiales bacterium]
MKMAYLSQIPTTATHETGIDDPGHIALTLRRRSVARLLPDLVWARLKWPPLLHFGTDPRPSPPAGPGTVPP